MKKIMTILSAALLLAGSLFVTGCSNSSDDDILGPVDTWCDVPITAKDGTTVLGYASFIYSENGFKSTSSGSSNLENGKEINNGITVVVWLNGNQSSESIAGTLLSGLTNNQYVIKNFSKDGTSVQDGTDSSTSTTVKGSKLIWNAGYIFNSNLRKADNQHKNPLAPTPITNGSSMSDVTSTLTNFTWKTLLKQLLINSL